MRRIQLMALGEVSDDRLTKLAASLGEAFEAECELAPHAPDLSGAFNSERGQYSSTQLLVSIAKRRTPQHCRALGVTSVDLYIPVLTFVFGEAQVRGATAIVSTHRLRQEFYGLPPDDRLLNQRLLKEALHELGHTFGLVHCADSLCVMAASHAVEWIDLKGGCFCVQCARLLAERFIG